MVLCALCGDPWPPHLERCLEWDRIVPGGPYTLRNSQLACPPCNRAKKNRTNAEAIRWITRHRHLTTYEVRGESREKYRKSGRGRMMIRKRKREYNTSVDGRVANRMNKMNRRRGPLPQNNPKLDL